MNIKCLKTEINKSKLELVQIVNNKDDLVREKVIEKSEKLDKLIINYMKIKKK
ncbi:Spo0E family sporulation regulatory protein-aspartic acid phosphatase [Selenihalanaerobacter shriftii]|uniref:Spo0E like sporulation regulatory protein n=1 Tax=Selenihalanaerobacter shriftii TaxID=142842 RepID=A0A1T4LYY8_9FIRM|nr:Spo0E family sporulation regulatory protein-aspartic acid phosphatase [Selenihalanaerobacter shriftii]SJZ59738.1 Spo0E like sporulation regulatory protein [Selenihalanaerobacter shriftii]